jgi:transposase
MRGDDRQPGSIFSYVSAEQRVPADHPLRAIRVLADDVLRDMSREFDGLYARVGRPSIPPERLLRAQLLQVFYSIRNERLLMEQLNTTCCFGGSSGWTWTSPFGRRRSLPRTAVGC